MFGRKNNVGTLEESLAEVGLNPTKVLGEIERVTGRLAEASKDPGGSGPPVAGNAPARSVENRNLYENNQTPGSKPEPKKPSSKVMTLAEQVRREMMAAGQDPAANVDEAFRAVKKLRKSAAAKLMARLARKGKKAALRTASRMYRKRNKRKILIRARKKLKKFGAKMLAKMHKSGKRIMMQHDMDKELANLRESLNTEAVEVETVNQYEEVAYNASLLSLHLGEVFESLGDKESAETMYTLSDVASDLSEDLEKIGEADLSEGQEEKLRRVLDKTVNAVRVWESFGSPTLFQAIEAGRTAAATA